MKARGIKGSPKLLLQEEDEVLFMNNTLFPRLRYARVKFDSELVRINGIGNAGIAAALCERAKVLQPKFLVSFQAFFFLQAVQIS